MALILRVDQSPLLTVISAADAPPPSPDVAFRRTWVAGVAGSVAVLSDASSAHDPDAISVQLRPSVVVSMLWYGLKYVCQIVAGFPSIAFDAAYPGCALVADAHTTPTAPLVSGRTGGAVAARRCRGSA